MVGKALKMGVWEMVKEGLTQKLLTWHLPPPPSLKPGQLVGINVIITGATNGIGLHTAREMAMAGANVILACRNIKSANRVISDLKDEAGEAEIHVEAMFLDLLSNSSILAFAEAWEKRGDPLHALINNAGVLFANEPQSFTEDGVERHMQVNHISHALLTLLLLPSLLRAPSARVIGLSSVSQYCATVEPALWESRIVDEEYNEIGSYGESKLAQLMFLKTLAAKLVKKGINSVQFVAVNPGSVKTNMALQYKVEDWKLFWMLSPAEGARSVLFCLMSDGVASELNDGFAYYTWACRPGKEAAMAMDRESCLAVWHKTMDILGLDADQYMSQVQSS